MVDIVRQKAKPGPKAPSGTGPRRLCKGGAIVIAVAGTLVGFDSAAHAGFMTQSAGFSILQTNPNGSLQSLQFNQLNPAVGTLQGISIAWNGNQEAFLAVSSATGGAWNLNVLNNLRLWDADTFALLANGLNSNFSGVLGAGGVSELHVGPSAFSGGTGFLAIDNALFQGTGTVDLGVTEGVVDAIVNSGPADLVTDGGTSDSTGTVQLNYIYTPTIKPVPEPGSAPLFATGLLSLGIALTGKRSRRGEPPQG